MSAMGKGSDQRDLWAALDEVEQQLKSMPDGEVVGAEDLEWSIGAVYVQAQVQSAVPLVVEVEASRGFLRRSSERRVVTLDPG